MSKRDIDFMREYKKDTGGANNGIYFAENLTVPVRMTLLSPDDDFAEMLRNRQPFEGEEEEDEYDCAKQTCFYCRFLKRTQESTVLDEMGAGAKRNLALDLITKFLFMINVDKIKLKKLISLRKYHPNVFGFCFFYMVFTRYLASYRLKFHVRKCVQELFYDVFRINPTSSIDR